ncbi:hypothetical protein LPJ78_001277 [Coemansia sp. RSA 989]|nr:hypothetical protein LPJ68_000387 [Coemansia sp. RSA 1086]KAJ1753473.1 hypothetical protein LPJ79_000332 [Coemansia sp. RSA 1821]KAJ1867064.1 hypothetical protein LPJ78_001277 [Coemansia sp. RSA 989]KAJ1875294.1 hypothetical protein LPJ55_000823 [Coemansia sp. RSA 990]KAJ2676626.1 hypothetical protein IWW42_000501 [Coemansia sp. RSA 1085]
MPTHSENGGMAVTASIGSRRTSSNSPTSSLSLSASPPASEPEQPIKVTLETEPPARKPGRPRLDISAHFQDTGEMANHSHRFVWCIGCIKSGRPLYKKDRLPARGDLMQRHIQTCKYVSDEVRQKFSSQRSSSASSGGDNKARKARIANIISESGPSSTQKANSTSPRVRSRLRTAATSSTAAAASAAPVSAAMLPPITAIANSEHSMAPLGPTHMMPLAVPSPRPLPPTLRPPYSQSRPGSTADGVKLPRIRSPQTRAAASLDLPPISRRPHPYLGREHHYGHVAGAAGLRGAGASPAGPVLLPSRNHPSPQHPAQRPFLAPPHQSSLRSSPSSVSSSTVAPEPLPAPYSHLTPPARVVSSPRLVPSSSLRQKLQTGHEVAYGIVLSIPSPVAARVAARLGFDWACIDMEHSPHSANLMAEMIDAIASSGHCAPLVRVPSHSSEWIRWAVEAGAHGIIIPNVQSQDQMLHLTRICRGTLASHQGTIAGSAYVNEAARNHTPAHQHSPKQPQMYQSTSPEGTRAALPGHSPQASAYNDEVLVIPQIDSLDAAMSSIEDILSVPGIDAAFVPSSGSSLAPAVARDRASSDALGHMLRIGQQLGIPLGTDSINGSSARMAARQGFRMVAIGTDMDVLASAASDQLHLAQTH